MSNRAETFNDGLMAFGSQKTILGKANKVIGKQFEKDGELFYKEMSAREEDLVLVKSTGKELNLKIKTYFPPEFIKKKQKLSDLTVVIDDETFEVFKADYDASKTFLFWYLCRV